MEELNSVWEIVIIAVIGGALIGAMVYRKFGSSEKETEQMKSELENARQELKNYKTGVNQHFDKTAELVNDLAQNYVKVYQHLAEGAQNLGDGSSFDNLLPPGAGQPSITVQEEEEKKPEVAPATEEDLYVDTVIIPDGVVEKHHEEAEAQSEPKPKEVIEPVDLPVAEEADKKTAAAADEDQFVDTLVMPADEVKKADEAKAEKVDESKDPKGQHIDPDDKDKKYQSITH